MLPACLLVLGASLAGGAAGSSGSILSPAGGSHDGLSIIGTGRVSFSAVVQPRGRRTTAYFQYGLGTRYREPKPPGVVYDESTPMVHLGADSRSHMVAGRASGLVPNALYHVRLVASSRAGTVYSPDSTFMTSKDPAPAPPRLGVAANVEPVSGLVLIEPSRAKSARVSSLVAGSGFFPLTETRRLPVEWHIDARAGSLRMVVASPQGRRLGRITLTGGVFFLTQSRSGPDRGLTVLDLLEGEFPGAPGYTGCIPMSTDVVQTLRARDQSGRFGTRGRYSAATASAAGAAWDTSDRCDGTLTTVRHGSVTVSDFRLGTTIAVQAGQSYLAQAP